MKSIKFDFNNLDVMIDGKGSVVIVEDLEAFAEWCKKTLLTERYVYPIYDHDYGVEFERLIGSALPRDFIEGEIKRIIKEALSQHPSFDRCENFTFEWKEDEVYFSCEVYMKNNESFTLEGEI